MNKRDIFFVVVVVFSVVFSNLGLGYIVTLALGFSPNLLLPTSIRLSGLFIIAVGVSFLGWTIFYRKPSDVMKSTYVTVVKALKRIDVKKNLGRTEPLTILGPYKYIRHPQYFGAVLLVVGWWLLLDYTFLFFGALFLFLWFRFVLIPFEEKELLALFGDQYNNYMRQVPSIIPFANVFRN